MKKMLMVISVLSIFMVAASFTDVNRVKGINQKDQEKATVYIYRVGQFNAASSNWAIFADEKKICKLSNNKYLKVEVTPGKHSFTAKVGGVEIFKKETGVDIEAEGGHSYYIACNVKQSITRSRLELLEVTKSSADKQMAKMSLDKCQEKLDAAEEK